MLVKLKSAIEKDIPLSVALWNHLQEFAVLRTLKKNEYLIKAGEACLHGYFINQGSLIQTFLNQNGKEVVQGFYIDETYAFMSSVSSYFSEKGSDFEIKAIEDCELVEFSKTQLEFLSTTYPEFALFYHKLTARGFERLYLLSAMRVSLSAEEFLSFLHKNYPQFLLRIPDKYIAEFMGVSKEWLSKLKKKLFKK